MITIFPQYDLFIERSKICYLPTELETRSIIKKNNISIHVQTSGTGIQVTYWITYIGPFMKYSEQYFTMSYSKH